ncbi:MAG: Crp/Fnr family transcriptional regulator [Dehalococcoidia bacterium]|nr:Crp/Fnr family transcriptional regulator [Dehalococcoidia bacterium]
MSARPRPPETGTQVSSAGCTLGHRLKLLQAVPLFRDLSPGDVARVNELFQSHSYGPDKTIYFAGSPAAHLYVLAHGKVKLLRHTAGGQDVVFAIIGPGEMFGSLATLGDREYPDDARALTHCCALVISAVDFQAVLERYPAVALAVLGEVSARLHDARDAFSQLSAMPVAGRVAAALLKLAEKLGVPHAEGILIQAPLSRQDLAAMTGTTTESVSRVMSQLRRDRVIASGRAWVAIRDVDRLASLAKAGG